MQNTNIIILNQTFSKSLEKNNNRTLKMIRIEQYTYLTNKFRYDICVVLFFVIYNNTI